VQLIGPEPDLRQRIDEALRGKPVRLTRIIRESSSSGSPAKRVSGLGSSLDELRPEEVFLERYRLSYHGDPPADLRNAFDQVYAAALAIESEVAA
jgi:exonuclease SbcD